MPELPLGLYQEIVNLMAPHFEDERERRSKLRIQLSQWPGWGNIVWTGSRDAFVKELVYQLPATQLKTALQALPGLEAEQRSAALSERIDQAVAVVEGSAADPLDAWLKGLIVRLSGPRSAVDRRFVQLSLLIDQGEDTPGIRFVPDGQRGRFDNLADLLADIGGKLTNVLRGATRSVQER